MNLMGWLHGGKRSKAMPAAPLPAPAEEPEPPRTSLLEKVAHWRKRYAEEKRAMASAEQIERLREAAAARRQELAEEEFARSIAAKGYYWPGEEPDEAPGSQEPGRMPNIFGGFWFRW